MAESAASNELVSDMMLTKVVTVKASDKVSRALHAMVRHKIGSVVVVEKRKPVGILTNEMSRREWQRAKMCGTCWLGA